MILFDHNFSRKSSPIQNISVILLRVRILIILSEPQIMNHTMDMEENLFQKLAEGDHTAFKQVYRIYFPRIHAFAYGFLKNKNEADELTQMVFIKLWDKHELFSEVRNFDSYLFILTKYTVFNYIKAKHTLPMSDEEIPDQYHQESPYEDLIANDLRLLIDLTINQMPPKRQQIFRMSRLEGFSNEEIAEKMGIQKKTVENHLNLALNELRKTIMFFLLSYIMSGLSN